MAEEINVKKLLRPFASFHPSLAGESAYLQQNHEEFYQLLDFLINYRPKIQSYLEIGTASGLFARYLKSLLFLDSYQCIAVDDGMHPHADLQSIFFPKDWLMIHGDSTNPEIQSRLMSEAIRFDLIVVDGGHDYATVFSDLNLASKLITPQGIIAAHDFVYCSDVAAACNDVCENGTLRVIKEIKADENPLGFKLMAQKPN